jgi:hypothetical protein
MYNIIDVELQKVQQALKPSRIVSSAPLPEGTIEEGNEPIQLHKITETIKVLLQKAREEILQAT